MQFFVAVPNLYNASLVGLPICPKSFEVFALGITFEKFILYLLTVYRPPKFVSERSFCSDFKKFLTVNKLFIKNLLTVGDFNFPSIDCVNCRVVKYSKCSLKFFKFSSVLH